MLKAVILEFRRAGHIAHVLIKKKDVLENLLDGSGLSYRNILPNRRTGGRLGVIWELLKRETRMLGFAVRNPPDILIGTSAEIAHVGAIINRPSLVLCEDDADVIPLFARVTYPFATAILSPHVCRAGRWEAKK